jgi:hypothetical protein
MRELPRLYCVELEFCIIVTKTGRKDLHVLLRVKLKMQRKPVAREIGNFHFKPPGLHRLGVLQISGSLQDLPQRLAQKHAFAIAIVKRINTRKINVLKRQELNPDASDIRKHRALAVVERHMLVVVGQ